MIGGMAFVVFLIRFLQLENVEAPQGRMEQLFGEFNRGYEWLLKTLS